MDIINDAKIFLRRIKPFKYGWYGNFISWEEAEKNSEGYDSNIILERIKEATLKIINGEVVYERDSMIFDHIEYSWPLLSLLLWISSENKNSLKLIDFGGSLGSTYFQNKKFLSCIDNCDWSIVEQENFVKAGKEIFKGENLQFFNTINDVINNKGNVDVILLSCTLPYIKDPYKLLNDLISFGIKYIIIENTFFNYINEDRLCIQKVSPEIYKASYPCWILNYNKVVETLKKNYSIVAEYRNESFMFLDGRKIQYRGFIAKLNESKV